MPHISTRTHLYNIIIYETDLNKRMANLYRLTVQQRHRLPPVSTGVSSGYSTCLSCVSGVSKKSDCRRFKASRRLVVGLGAAFCSQFMTMAGTLGANSLIASARQRGAVEQVRFSLFSCLPLWSMRYCFDVFGFWNCTSNSLSAYLIHCFCLLKALETNYFWTNGTNKIADEDSDSLSDIYFIHLSPFLISDQFCLIGFDGLSYFSSVRRVSFSYLLKILGILWDWWMWLSLF